MAMTLAAKEALWLSRFFTEIGCTGKDLETVTIHADNQGAIALAKNPEHHARTKHIDVQYHFIREHVEANRIKLNYLSTHDMAADGLTKPLLRQKFQEFVNMLGMRGNDTQDSALTPEQGGVLRGMTSEHSAQERPPPILSG